MKYLLGYITTKDKKEAEKISWSLLKSKLIECVNIVDKVKSIYWWQGKIEDSEECLMLVKTKKSLAKKIIDKVKSLHSYRCPCIIFIPIETGNRDYLKWIDQSTR